MNQLAVKDRFLHRIAQRAVGAVQARATKEPDFATSAISGLMGSSGAVNFDAITKTKAIEKLVTGGSIVALKQIRVFLESLCSKPGTDDPKQAAGKRQIIADLLQVIVTKSDIAKQAGTDPDAESCIRDTFLVLVKCAYSNGADMEPTLMPTTRQLFQNRVTTSLNYLMRDFRTQASEFAYAAVNLIHQTGRVGVEASQEIWASVDEACTVLKRINKAVGQIMLLHVSQADNDDPVPEE